MAVPRKEVKLKKSDSIPHYVLWRIVNFTTGIIFALICAGMLAPMTIFSFSGRYFTVEFLIIHTVSASLLLNFILLTTPPHVCSKKLFFLKLDSIGLITLQK